LAQRYYDATSWIFRWAWGSSFHFAPLRQNESRRAAIERYERNLATELALDAQSRCVDLGCGIGGPGRAIASYTGAHIVGVNSNLGQLRSLQRRNARGGGAVVGLAADFAALPFAAASFDRAYAFEALCHAVDLRRTLREVHRILRPGGMLAFSEWYLTGQFDSENPTHRVLRSTIETSYGVVELRSWSAWETALADAGFRIVKRHDHGECEGQGMEPWYHALQPRDRTLDSLGRSAPVRAIEAGVLRFAERCGLAPSGTAATVRQLRIGTAALSEAGRRGIFTPMLLVVAEKRAC
jgi:sterol 24-C-methyltransferase